VSGGIWRVYAPEYYIVVHRTIEKGAPSGGLRSTMLTLQEGTVQAVFTSVELARDFAETFYAEEDHITPVVTSMDAFKLAHSVDLSEEVGVREVVFDPEATSVGQWTDPQAIMPLSYFRRFIAELDSGLEKLIAEAYMALGYGPEGPPLEVPWVKEEKAWMMEWCWSRVDDVAEDARARASEWETSPNPRPR
jgi:hypothetical protein